MKVGEIVIVVEVIIQDRDKYNGAKLPVISQNFQSFQFFKTFILEGIYKCLNKVSLHVCAVSNQHVFTQ